MLISILVLIETSLKGNGCNLANSDRNHRNVSVTQLQCCELLHPKLKYEPENSYGYSQN